jgi:hypothetical protein
MSLGSSACHPLDAKKASWYSKDPPLPHWSREGGVMGRQSFEKSYFT